MTAANQTTSDQATNSQATNSQTTASELGHRLQSDLHTFSKLRELLDSEKAALRVNDIPLIAALAANKQTLLDQTRESARQKIRLLVKMGYRPDVGDPARFLAGAGLTALAENWHACQKGLADCKQINEVNGRVIVHMQRRTEQLASILRGAASGRQQTLYGQSGRTHSLTHSTILASA